MALVFLQEEAESPIVKYRTCNSGILENLKLMPNAKPAKLFKFDGMH